MSHSLNVFILLTIVFSILISSTTSAPSRANNGATINTLEEFSRFMANGPRRGFTQATPTVRPEDNWMSGIKSWKKLSEKNCEMKFSHAIMDICQAGCTKEVDKKVIENICLGVDYSDAKLIEECCPKTI